MSFFDDRIQPTPESSVRTTIVGFMQGAALLVTNWRIVGVATQMLEAVVSGAAAFMTLVPGYVRGFAGLDFSTDPGDEDPYDSTNVDLTPGAGFLSAYGLNTYGTEREEASFATGHATFVNAGPGSRDIAPEGLIYTQTGGTPPSPPPTYINTADPTVYTNPDGTLTVAAGDTVSIPVTCQIQGALGSAPSSTLSLTTSLTGCTGTNPLAILGNDREDRPAYIARCRQAAARLSLGGPGDAYAYLAKTNLDGTVLLNDANPPVATGITRTQVTQESSTGVVNAYYASASGTAVAEDISAANTNIRLQALAVPDAITFNGVSATPDTLHVAGTAKIKARAGVTRAAVAAGMVASLVTNGKEIPIGGVDQVAGAGVVYTRDLEAYARAGYDGVYDVIVTTPAGLSTALAVGHVAVIDSAAGDGAGSGDWVITLVS